MGHAALALLVACSTATAQQFRPSRFATIPVVVPPFSVRQIDAGDVDGDGFPDLVLALGQGGVACLGSDRHGGFVDRTTAALAPAYADAWGAVLGDYDADGDPDLAVVHEGTGYIQVCENRGGTFVDVTAALSLPRVTRPYVLTWVDVDGDRLLELFVAYGSTRNDVMLLRQQGGRLVDVTATYLIRVGSAFALDFVEASDVDADGDQDLVLFGSDSPVLINDGARGFGRPPAGTYPLVTSFSLVASGDFDGDGLVDMVVSILSSLPKIFFQTPGGTYVDRSATHFSGIGLFSTRRLVASDVDLDGDLDLCAPGHLLVNDGSGRFSDATSTRWTTTQPDSPVWPLGCYTMADIDADGDPDFLVADRRSNWLVTANHHRHVWAPSPPVRGAALGYRIDFSASPGYATGTTIAWPWYSTAPGHLHIPPFGHLGLDPARIIYGAAVAIPSPAGVASLTFTVPNSPSLAGVPLHVQALEVTGSVLRTTNTMLDPIQ